ncbi:hypothetical protein VCRA2110O1_190074 [Vibrio crassostreae]|nr:hypothetical protein VCRA2110O1_190074 [Vibrio crassostreae]CAK1878623.1 hypothetical protein VCRA2110O4_200073 [Vibrio crassostreae]CAK1893324.1 hypothetical protein VCRA2114E5_200073 [Vibrio crassostreae]CAK2331230.1 hypothetical protein VCRA2110O318_30202 [Vibrio crassostreae]CAK2498777.1 hypothetical protein VCRA2110O319_40202 [Vibrio crassostreae]
MAPNWEPFLILIKVGLFLPEKVVSIPFALVTEGVVKKARVQKALVQKY